MNYSEEFLSEVEDSIGRLHINEIEAIVNILSELRDKGRLFILGSGGGAGHASPACADFRKLCNIEAYAIYENTSETTARINDNGWNSSAVDWLTVSKFNYLDCLLVISVGGGQSGVSENISEAVRYAKIIGARIIGIVGKAKSCTGENADVCIVVKTDNVTPVTEGLQSVILHLLCTHPKLQISKTKW
jgi:D-sedoheptulose 7-phosphate isomerase